MTEVLSAPGNGSPHFSPPDLLHRSSSHTLLTLKTSNSYHSSSKSSYLQSEYGPESSGSAPSSAPSSPQLQQPVLFRTPSYTSTPASSLSFDSGADQTEADEHDIQFPFFDVAKHHQEQQKSDSSGQQSCCLDEEPAFQPKELQRTHSSQFPQTVHDDHAVEDEPTRHVDYLSHQWREEDIWSSWRYIVARRNRYSNSVRLENASWRTWTKARCDLKTVSPETLNWLKDCDVTWLYGPLHTDSRKALNPANSSAPSRLSTSSSFTDKKPILKKKSASQTILQRSISSHSLLKQAGAMLQAQQAGQSDGRPSYIRASSELFIGTFCQPPYTTTPAGEEAPTPTSTRYSDTSSGLESPSERRHIHFNNEVEQCIAVDSKDDDEAEDEMVSNTFHHHDLDRAGDDLEDAEGNDDDEEVVMMRPIASKPATSNRGTPRNSFSSDGKTIKSLPSTTLKYRGDTPEPNEAQQTRGMNVFWPTKKTLSPSPSQETLRPSRRQTNFLLDDDDEDVDVQWQPSSYTGTSSSIYPDHSSPYHLNQPSEDDYDPGPGMRRTPSGMFMPYDRDEEETAMNDSLFGRVIDTVNTAKDIAHVIWNVGWRT